MSIKTQIINGGDNLVANIKKIDTNENGLITLNHPLKQYQFAQRYFLNPIYGSEMNQNGSGFIDLEELVYDEDVGAPAEWNWTAIVGNWTFNSGVHAYHGTVSIDGTQTGNGSIAQGATTALFDLSDYNVLTGYIYITSWSSVGTKQVQIRGRNTGTGTIVGNNVDIGNYINKTILNSWQRFIIPLTDMGLNGQSIDAVRVQTVSIGGGDAPDYFLDFIEFGGTTGADATGVIEYKMMPDAFTWFHVCGINMTFVGEYDSTLVNGTIQKIPPFSLLNVPQLDNGILFTYRSGGELTFNAVFHNLIDFISLTPLNIISSGTDGTYTWFKLGIQFEQPLLLKWEEEDYISFTIRDDLTDLSILRSTVCSKIEQRQRS